MSFGLAGELGYSVIPVGWQLDNTDGRQGDTLYVLVGGGVFGGFAALHYWFPKISGRLHRRRARQGRAAGDLRRHSTSTCLPMFFAGLEGQPVDVFEYYEDTGVDGYNLIASIGAFVLVLGILLELGNAAHSWNNGIRPAATTRGPARRSSGSRSRRRPPHNFDAVPDVRSGEPLHDIRESIAIRERAFTAAGALEPVASRSRGRAGAEAEPGRRRRPSGRH